MRADVGLMLTNLLEDVDRGFDGMVDLLATAEERPVRDVVRALLAAGEGPPGDVAELWWTLLTRRRFGDQVRKRFASSAPSADAVRLHRNLCHRFAAGMAAASASRYARRDEPASWRDLLSWLSRPLDGSPPLPVGDDPADRPALDRPSRLVLRAWEQLADRGREDPRALIYRRDHALRWLDHGQGRDHEFGEGLAEITVEHQVDPPVGGYDTASKVGFLCRLRLERLAEASAAVEARPELTEHPEQWWRPLGADLVAAVEEAWRALREPVPSRWRLTVDDPARATLPLWGRSLSAAAHAGFRLLARGVAFRDDSLILAEIREAAPELLRPVNGVVAKIEAAVSGELRGAIRYAFHAATLPHEDRPTPEQRDRWRRDAGLEVIAADRLGEVLDHVGQDPVVTAYLEWVAAEHGKLRVLGIPGVGAAPTVDLDKVYVALRGYETLPGEFRAQIRLMQEAKERAPEKAQRLFGVALEDRPTAPEELEQLQVMLTPMLLQHVETDRQARRRRPGDGEPAAPELNLGEAFARHRRLVILGDPGSGKTTLLRWLARRMADALRLPAASGDGRRRLTVPRFQVDPNLPDDPSPFDLGPARLPVLARASELAGELRRARERREEQPSLAECLARPRWDQAPPSGPRGPLDPAALARLILDAIADGRAVVLIDGLDEVTTAEDRRALLDAVDRFLERSASSPGTPAASGGNQVVVTSRVVGYWLNPVSPELASTTFTVLPMGRPAVAHFCRNWSTEVARQQALRDGRGFDPGAAVEAAVALVAAVFDVAFPARAVLAGNPLLLTIMAAAFHRDHALPGRRIELYRLTVDYLLDVWCATADRETPWKALGAVAEKIHQNSPNNLIRSADVRGVVSRVYQAGGARPADADRMAESFLDNARLHVGLLLEVSPGIWRFQHQNVQEYLAARHLLAEGAAAAVRAFLERQDNPRWRESLRMALGYASDHMDGDDFRGLLEALLGGSGDALAGALPRGALLVVDALAEMDPPRVPGWLWLATADRLLAAYADRAGIGRFAPLRARIESALRTLHGLWPSGTGVGAVNGLEAFLTDQLRAAGRAPAVAALVRNQGWSSYRLVRELYEARRHDRAEDGWAVDAALRALAFATLPPEPIPDPAAPLALEAEAETETKAEDAPEPPWASTLLPFRTWFLSATAEGLEPIAPLRRDPAWMRLTAALFGGFRDEGTPEILSDYYRYIKQCQLGGVIIVPDGGGRAGDDRDDPIYAIAVLLDTSLGARAKRVAVPPRFRGEYLWRDTYDDELSRVCVQHLERAGDYPEQARGPLLDLAADLRAAWDDPARPEEHRAEALVGLVALGPEVVADYDAVLAGIAARPRAAAELRRLQQALRDPVVRASHQLMTRLQPRELARQGVDVVGLVSGLIGLALEHGSPPLRTDHLLAPPSLDDPADAPALADDARTYLTSESWARWLSGCSEDIRYDAAVVLDTLGKRFSEAAESTCRVFAATHRARNLDWSGHLGWPVERIPPRSDEPLDIALAALDTLATIPEELEFVRYWSLTDVMVAHLRRDHPEALAELFCVMFSGAFSASFDYIEPHLPRQTDLPGWLVAQAGGVSDPYLRARALARLASREFRDRAAMAEAARVAARRTRPRSLHRALALERVVPLLPVRDEAIDEAAAAARALDADNRARCLARLARHAAAGRRAELIDQAIEAAAAVPDEPSRSELIALLRDEWPADPEAAAALDRLARSATTGQARDRALGRLGATFTALDLPGRLPGAVDPDAWQVVTLAALVGDALRAVGPPERVPSLWERFRRGDREAAGRLRQLGSVDGLPLTGLAAAALAERLEPPVAPEVLEVLPLVHSPEPAAIAHVDGWLAHPDRTVRRAAALLLAEAGQLRVDTLPGVVECLAGDDDRFRYRASRVCYHDRYARQVRGLGRATMEAISRAIEQHRVRKPSLTIALYWLWQRVQHNDPEATRAWIDAASADRPDQEIYLNLLRNVQLATPAVAAVILDRLSQGPPRVVEALVESVTRLFYKRQIREEAQDPFRQALQALARGGATESLRCAAVLAFGRAGWTDDDDAFLVALADDPAVPVSVRGKALAVRGQRAALAADALIAEWAAARKQGRPEAAPRPERRDAVIGRMAQVVDHSRAHGRLRPFDASAPAADRTLRAAAAEAVAHLFLVVSRPEALEAFDARAAGLPTTLEELRETFAGDPIAPLWGLLDTERFALYWDASYKTMVARAAALAQKNGEMLMPVLVEALTAALTHPPRPGSRDFRGMTLLDVTAEAAVGLPTLFNIVAQGFPQLGDLLARAARQHSTFPGRAAAVTLLSFVYEPEPSQVADAFAASLRDVWLVQRAALAAADRLHDRSEAFVDTLLAELEGPSAITAYAAARILTHVGSDDRTRVELRQRILARLAAAAVSPAGRREVFRLDENASTDRWCTHYLGRLDDVLYDAMMTIAGLN